VNNNMVRYTHSISLTPTHQPISLKQILHSPKHLSQVDRYKDVKLYHLRLNGKVIFKLFLQNERDCRVLEYALGLIVLTPSLLMYSDGQLTLKTQARNILNIALYKDHIIVLTESGIYKLNKEVFRRRSRGTFKFPLKSITQNIEYGNDIHLLNFRERFGYFRLKQHIMIHSSYDILLIQESRVIAHRKLSETIVSFDSISSQTILNTLSGSYVISVLEEDYSYLKEPSSPRDYKLEHTVAKYLSRVEESCTITDILWEETIGNPQVNDFIKTWHLEPLDRKTLKSTEFYRDTMYDLLKYRLAVSVFSIYKDTPHLLVQLREAIREQETSIYADGLISPDDPLTSLITENMPLPLLSDSQDQRNIRETFNML